MTSTLTIECAYAFVGVVINILYDGLTWSRPQIIFLALMSIIGHYEYNLAEYAQIRQKSKT